MNSLEQYETKQSIKKPRKLYEKLYFDFNSLFASQNDRRIIKTNKIPAINQQRAQSGLRRWVCWTYFSVRGCLYVLLGKTVKVF